MQVLSNLPCIHPLSSILGHDGEELRLEVFIGDGWTANTFDFRFTSGLAGEEASSSSKRGDDLAGVGELELQLMYRFGVESCICFCRASICCWRDGFFLLRMLRMTLVVGYEVN